MILGAEHALFAINSAKSSEHLMQNKRESPFNNYKEMTTSLTSSYMFGANELQNVKSQIAQHLNEQNGNIVEDEDSLLQEKSEDTNIENKERMQSQYDVS